MARSLQRRDLLVERGDALAGHLAGARAILAAMELEQLGDLGQGEARGLRLPDLAQAAQVLRVIMSPSGGVSPRNGEQALALVEANRFDADAPGPREIGYPHRFHA